MPDRLLWTVHAAAHIVLYMNAAANTAPLYRLAHQLELGHPLRTRLVSLAVEVQVRAEQRAQMERVRRDLAELCKAVQP